MACSKLLPASYLEEMLTCSVCSELVTEPQTLTRCMHNYCADCVEQLMEKQDNTPRGVHCPVCRSFSEEKDIRRNHFVNELLSQHKASLEGEAQARQKPCDQCSVEKPGTAAAWKCLDCRFHLCDTCRAQHLRLPLLKGHSILELSEETEFVIDHLVFCSTHPEKLIEFYCNKCEEALCITCHVVNHSGHNIVTVQNALDRLVPDIDQDLKSLDESLNIMDQGVQRCDVELEEVEKNFKQCSDAVDKEAEDRVEKIRKEQDKMKTDLANEKQTQKSLIEDKKNLVANRRKEIGNLSNVTRTSLERARHASLLSELVIGGLCKRLKEVATQPSKPQSLTIKKPTLQLKTHRWAASEEKGLLGEITYTTDKTVVVDGLNITSGVNTAVSRYWPRNFTEFFKKPLRQTLQIELHSYCTKITVSDDNLWAPVYWNNVVEIYTCDGELVESVKVEGKPTCVEKTATGEMLVSCAESGLFVLSEDSDNAVQVAGGSYTDLCVCGESVFTWDWRNKQIVEFVKEDGDWRQKSVISVGCVEKTNDWDTLLVRQCGEDRTRLEFFVCARNQHTVYQVNSQGDKVRQFGSETKQADGRLQCPRLCGVDSHGDILVANSHHHKYKLLNTASGHWRTVFSADSAVYDGAMEGENTVWLSRNTDNRSVITKHEVML